MIDATSTSGCVTKAEHDAIVARIGRPLTQDLPGRRQPNAAEPNLSIDWFNVEVLGNG